MKSLKIIILSTLFVFALSIAKGQNYFGNINNATNEVKAALATHNAVLVNAKGQALILALSQPEKVSVSERRAFGSYIGVLLVEARHITETKNLNYQQTHYNLFAKEWSEAETKLKVK